MFKFYWVDRIAEVVAETIRDKSDVRPIGTSIGAGMILVHQIANHTNNIQIGSLRSTADQICFSNHAARENHSESTNMTADITPVAAILPVAMNRNNCTRVALCNGQGN